MQKIKLSRRARAVILARLTSDYLEALDALCERHPRTPREHYLHDLARVELGRARVEVSTKLGVAATPGEFVLLWSDLFSSPGMALDRSFWSNRNRVKTGCSRYSIEPI